MAAINFEPDSPSNGDTFVANGVTYTYDGTKWKTTINSNAFLPLTGGTLSGNLTLGSNQLTAGGLTYPTSDGTTGQYLQTDGNGALSFQTVTDTSTSVAVLVDEKTENTNGGTFTADAWRTRDLNTEVSDPDGIVTLSSNQFTLGAGTYLIAWECPCYRVGFNQSRLYDITGAAAVEGGMSFYVESSAQYHGTSNGSAVVTITASNVYEIQHFCSNTRSTDGFGVRGSAGPERYTRVTISKVA